MPVDYGKVYTSGSSFRARAEARQRCYRAETLRLRAGRYGHLLCQENADAGKNFVHTEAHGAARSRQAEGKGVAERTFDNMLSSQAMCFNIFAPLSERRDLAAQILAVWIPDLKSVESISIEHTPDRDVFSDQTGRGGVDCDLLVEGISTNDEKLVLVMETKFVEPEFSVCGFRKLGRAEEGKVVCPDDVSIGQTRDGCLYQTKKKYQYWNRSDQHLLLRPGAVPESGCPFSGQLWQLWVNYCLAHEEATRRGAKRTYFGVCAPANNDALLQDGKILDGFRGLLSERERLLFIDLDRLISTIEANLDGQLQAWVDGLKARYANI